MHACISIIPVISFLDNDHVSLVFVLTAGISLPRQLQGRSKEIRTMIYSAVLAERCALFVRQPRSSDTIGQPVKKCAAWCAIFIRSFIVESRARPLNNAARWYCWEATIASLQVFKLWYWVTGLKVVCLVGNFECIKKIALHIELVLVSIILAQGQQCVRTWDSINSSCCLLQTNKLQCDFRKTIEGIFDFPCGIFLIKLVLLPTSISHSFCLISTSCESQR